MQEKHVQNSSGIGVGKPAKTLKRGRIGPRLPLMTNSKSYTRYRLMPKSTLDDLEGPLRTLVQNMRFRSQTRQFE